MRKSKKILAICLAIASISCVFAITASALSEYDYSTWSCYTKKTTDKGVPCVNSRTQIHDKSLISEADVVAKGVEVDNHGYTRNLGGHDHGATSWAMVTMHIDSGYKIANASAHHEVYHKTTHYYGSEDTEM